MRWAVADEAVLVVLAVLFEFDDEAAAEEDNETEELLFSSWDSEAAVGLSFPDDDVALVPASVSV